MYCIYRRLHILYRNDVLELYKHRTLIVFSQSNPGCEVREILGWHCRHVTNISISPSTFKDQNFFIMLLMLLHVCAILFRALLICEMQIARNLLTWKNTPTFHFLAECTAIFLHSYTVDLHKVTKFQYLPSPLTTWHPEIFKVHNFFPKIYVAKWNIFQKPNAPFVTD